VCGIAGIVGDVSKEEVIASMIEVMHHRGPDARGFYVSKKAHLGHCRLSINDLSQNANQPFIDENQTTVVLVNGEIYNYMDLKKQLLNAGYKFTSLSDSEVVLHAYLEYGLDFVRDLNGMFAIAIWNAIENELILFRDRLGIKPLYYAHTKRSFLFASEIKALAQYENLEFSLDLQSFSEYLSFENYFSNRTLNRNIKMVQPGEIVSFTTENSKVRRENFWQPAFGQQFHSSGENVYERYISIVQASVKRHLISDVPVGAYLSSGIDSSSVVYYASRLLKKNLETYTGCFEMSGFYDEATTAHKIAEEFGCSNNKICIQSEDFIDNIEDVLWHLDEPRVGMGSFSQYMVAKRAAKDVKVILTGHGGDEFFAGYPVFKAIYGKQQALELILKSSLRELMFAFYFIVYPRFRKEARYFFPNIYSIRSLQHILNTEFLDCLTKEADALKELNALKFACPDEYERLTSTYLKLYLPALFTVEDKISMAFSLESRTPLCDNELLDFALSIPLSMKLSNQELKHIPRTAMRNRLPDFVFNLPKRGFPTPLGLWFKKKLNSFIREYILDNIVCLNMFNAEMVEKNILRWIDSRVNTPIDEIKAHKVWILLNLIIYFKNQKRKYKRT
jgi:asparagine synthase (glutamine-hydrolysing)